MTPSDKNQRTGRSARDEGIQVLRRAAAALDEIATEPGRLRLVDLEARLGLAKSTVRRLMVGLTDVGLAAVDEQGRYLLGTRLLALTSADSAGLAARFRPALEQLAARTGETVDLSVLRGRQMWFIDQVESAHRLRAVSAVGVRFPLGDTANGKAALARLEEAAADSLMAGLDEATVAKLRTELPEIRRTGIAFDRDEHTVGISAAGVAGRTADGQMVAISVPAPTERFRANEAAIVAALRDVAANWTG
ncbi:IclR family transcriptional regulator [Mycolicibacterium sp. F2034L]|uniref:IclR family transcriptional regulator n=1 Tax=Mycolicibacterium sp. F2034L TaxID=2926422 RepID=UPI001FF19721|nr:IclR family transcriptional regulator [Mycolicibacterium sp. F2034L]MCK0177121.1 IclR family transcriptional regulator [Mycolicibacterium sp. F2034L]